MSTLMIIEITEFARCENCKSINKVPSINSFKKNHLKEKLENEVSYFVILKIYIYT